MLEGGDYNKMRLHFLGTGAAEGVPAMFCNCPTCAEVRRRGGKEVHTRSQVVVDGVLGIEFPPDAYYHSFAFGVDLSAIKNIIVTHSHMDHFYAHDFILRGYKYAHSMTEAKLNIFGSEAIGEVFAECTRRELKPMVAENIAFTPLSLYTEYDIGGYTITPLRAQHTVGEVTYLYLIEKDGKAYLHLTDTGRLPKEVYSYLAERGKKVNAVTFDCTFLNFTKGSVGRHMGIGDNMVVKSLLEKNGVCDNNTKYYITHFSHNSAPLSENLRAIEKEYNVIALYDGMVVDV